jgi:hypothetical protein
LSRFGTVKSVKIIPYIKSTVPKEPNGTGMNDTYKILENGPDETENADSSALVSSTGDEQINDIGQIPVVEEEFVEKDKGSVSEISTEQELDSRYDASEGETSHNGNVSNGVVIEEEEDSEDIFVAGSVLVEFVRKEAACVAAHELHGELFGGRIMEAGYAPLELFLERFSTK